MAKRNLEDELLAGASKLSLIAKDYTSEEIDKTAEEIEKKNPNETASFRDRLGLKPRKDTELPSVESSSESPSADSEPPVRELLSMLEAQQSATDTSPVQPEVAQPDALRVDIDPMKLEGSSSFDITSNPAYDQWLYNNMSPVELVFKTMQEDEGYKAKMSEFDTEVETLTKKIEEGFEPYTKYSQKARMDRTITAEEQEKETREQLTATLEQMQRTTELFRQDAEEQLLRQAWLRDYPEPMNVGGSVVEPGPFGAETISGDTKEWSDWTARAIEHEDYMFTQHGVRVDLNGDGIRGEGKPLADLGMPIAMAFKTALDMFVFSAAGVGKAYAEANMNPILSKEINDWAVDWALNSNDVQKSYESYMTDWDNNWRDDWEKGDLSIDNFFAYGTGVYRDVVRSSPQSILALGAGALGGPAVGTAALGYTVMAEQYFRNQLDPRFDTLTDENGNVIKPTNPLNSEKLSFVNEVYNSPDFQPQMEDGRLFVTMDDGERIYIEKNQEARVWHAVLTAGAESIPEALAVSGIIRGVKHAANGRPALFSPYVGAWLESMGIGFTAESLQGLTTSISRMIIDKNLLDENLTASEIMARALEETFTEGVGGAGMGGTLFGIKYNPTRKGKAKFETDFTIGELLNHREAFRNADIEFDLETFQDRQRVMEALESPEITEEEAEVLQRELNTIESKSSDKAASVEGAIEQLYAIDPTEAMRLMSLLNAKSAKIQALSGDGLRSSAAKAVVKEEMDALDGQIDTIIGNLVVASDEGTQDQAIETIVADFTNDIFYTSRNLTEGFEVTSEDVARGSNLSVEEAQALLDNPAITPTAALAATKLVEDAEDVVLYKDRDDFLANAPKGKYESLAYFDKTTGKIHISPEASAIDIYEEGIHETIELEGYTEEEVQEMADKLLQSEDPIISGRANEISRDREGDAEEVVVGMVRENPRKKFGDKNLDRLSDQAFTKFSTPGILAGVAPSMTQQRYNDLQRTMVADGLRDMNRRSSIIGPDPYALAESMGYDPQTMTFDELAEVERMHASRSVRVEGTIDVQDATITRGSEATLELQEALAKAGVTGEAVVILMPVDETGINTIGDVAFVSGLEGELLQAGQPVGTLATTASQSKATLLKRMVAETANLTEVNGLENQDVVILYTTMGPDATISSEIYTMSAVSEAKKIFEEGGFTEDNIKGLVYALQGPESKRVTPRYAIRVVPVIEGKETLKGATYKFFDKKKEAQKYLADLRKKQKAKEKEVAAIEKEDEKRDEQSKQRKQGDLSYDVATTEIISVAKTPTWVPTPIIPAFESLVDPKLTVAEKQEHAETILNYLSDPKNRDSFTYKLNGSQRTEINNRLKSVLGIQVDVSEIRDPNVPEGAYGTINGGVVANIRYSGTEFGRGTKVDFVEGKGQYEWGIQAQNMRPFTLSTPLNENALRWETKRDRNMLHGNEVVERFVIEEAKKDRESSDQYEGDSTMDAIMGLPDSEFTVYYTEESGRSFYDNDLFTQMQRSKTFNDGWHFWNWWVQQTGNGALKGGIIGFGYTDPVTGEFKKIDNIPTKKDRETREPLKVEPKFKSLTRRRIEGNERSAINRQNATRAQAEQNKELEQEIRNRLEGGDLSFELLQGSIVGQYAGVNVLDEQGTFNLLTSIDNLNNVLLQSREMETGGIIQFAGTPIGGIDFSQMPNEHLDNTTSIELASREIKTDRLRADVAPKFFDRYQVLAYHNDNIVHSIEKTEDGYKLTVSLNISNSNQELIDAVQGKEIPRSREGLIDLVKNYRVTEDTQEARIMPPRYYDLKQQRGSWTGTVDFMNGWLVNKYADILGFEKEQEQLRGSRLPQSQRFSEVEQLMYGKARYAMEQLDNTMQTAKDFMVENGISHQDLSQFMYALHAQERNEQIQKKRPDLLDGSGMSTERALEIIDELDSPQMRQAAQFFYDIIHDTRQTMADKGLEPLDKLDAWEQLYTSYVPLQGFAQDELDPGGNAYPTGGAGMAVYGSKVKKAIGRESEAANVLANIVMQNAVTHQWAEKNVVLTSLHDMTVKNEMMEDVWSVVDNKKPLTKLDEDGNQVPMTIMEMQSDAHTVPVRINGEQKFIYFNDPYYADVLNGMTMEQTNTFLRAMRAPVSWLRGVFTQWDPNFFVSNFARDMGGSLYNAAADVEGGFFDNIDQKGFQKKMMSNSFKSLNALLGEAVKGKQLPPEMQQFHDEWKEDGGQTGWNFVKDLKDIEAQLATNVDDLTRGKQLREKLFSSPKRFFEFVEGVNDAFENSIRLSAYMTARQQGASRQQAAVFSKNITVNFNRQGEAGPAINTMYLFFNAAIQGNMRFVDAMTTMRPIHKPDGSTREWYERATGAQKIAAGMAGFSGMLTLLNLAMSGVDEEDGELWYNKVSEYDKMRNMIICYGPNRDDFMKIPLPYGYGLFNNAGLALAEVSTGNRSVNEAMMYLGTTAFTSFSPISFGGEIDNPGTFVTRSLLPTTLKPFAEMSENRTYFGSQITGEQLPFGTPVPKSELQYRSPQQVQKFFRWMNEATGGSQFKSGWADFNPDYTYYMFEYLIGGSGDFVLSTGEQARNLFEMSKRAAEGMEGAQSLSDIAAGLQSGFGEEGEVKINYSDVPIVKKVYGEASPFYDIDNFKQQGTEIEQLYREIKEGVIVQDPGRYKGVQQLHKDYLEANKALRAIRKSLRGARDIDDYIERQNRITDLYEAQRRVMARWNKRYKDLRGQN